MEISNQRTPTQSCNSEVQLRHLESKAQESDTLASLRIHQNSEDIKQLLVQKQTQNENSSSKIWSSFTSSRIKEVREIIQITEQKSSTSQNQESTQPSSSQNKLSYHSDHKQSLLQNKQFHSSVKSQQKSIQQDQILVPKTKEQYFNKELFSSHSYYLNELLQKKAIDKIHSRKMKKFFANEFSQNEKYTFKQTQIKVLENFIKKFVNQNQTKTNIIHLIDLLYKKFIIKPEKDIQALKFGKKPFNIYDPSPIQSERFYSLKDNSLGDNLQKSQSSQSNSLKRNGAGRTYNENYVLVDNESTNDNQDYLEAIASNYVNGIRKSKYSDAPIKTQFQLKPQIQQSGPDKYKIMYGGSHQPELPLPFDINIQIPQQAANRQFNPAFNAFQSADDEKNQRFQQQRLIAKTFVKDGYGLQIVRNYLGPKIDGGSYNRAITTIIRQSYKKIQDFLSKQCGIKIRSLTSSQFSLVKTPLVHCRNILRPQDLRTFFKYIAITYKFGKIKQGDYPNAQQTTSLYQSILRGLNDRKSAKDINPKPAKEKDLYFNH